MKEIGLVAEVGFQLAAIERGFIISIPRGEQVYDCILDNGNKLFRIQVKSTSKERFDKKDKFRILLTSGNAKRPYAPHEVDIFAIYITPLKLWYFVPQSRVNGRIHLAIHPNSNNCEVKEYKNQWSIFDSSSSPPLTSLSNSP